MGITHSQKSGLSKILNSELFKSIYPMIDSFELVLLEKINMLIIQIILNDETINHDNMYQKGFDPHYLTDIHLSKVLPYLGIPRNLGIGYVIKTPNGEVIDSFLP